MYSDPAKLAVIEGICLQLQENLIKYSSYDKEGTFEPPTALLWLYYYLGQHYDYKKDYDAAIAIVEKAIEHTPTLIELFVLKGKIYKVTRICLGIIHVMESMVYYEQDHQHA